MRHEGHNLISQSERFSDHAQATVNDFGWRRTGRQSQREGASSGDVAKFFKESILPFVGRVVQAFLADRKQFLVGHTGHFLHGHVGKFVILGAVTEMQLSLDEQSETVSRVRWNEYDAICNSMANETQSQTLVQKKTTTIESINTPEPEIALLFDNKQIKQNFLHFQIDKVIKTDS